MSHRRRRPRARLALPPLEAGEAVALVALCERLLAALWHTYGNAMIAHGEAQLDAKADRLPPKPYKPPSAPPLADDDLF